MPRENRKRGKKHKRPDVESHEDQLPNDSEQLQQPSWIHSAEPPNELNPEAPYGYVDNDVKAYFRTVDVQIRDWQENGSSEDASDGDRDPNEERHLFFVAALTEMSGKERQLATDPDCSVILERMAHSMDDFVRRVFVDSLAGSFETLSRHRFASHVCQTMLTVARDTISRETRGITPDVPENSEHGELRTMTQLVLDVCEELLSSIGSLILDPFASHVVRSLLVLLTPRLAGEESSKSSLRSKKSQKWKSKQGPMRSVFSADKGKNKEPAGPAVPPQFRRVSRKIVESLRNELSDTEIRALAANKVASPALKMLIDVEADQGLANDPGSLMDSVTMGIVSCLNARPLATVEASDYVNTLLRDTTSSHLLETVIMRCPDPVFRVIWKTYFSEKLPRLAVHPVANFVVVKAIERVSLAELSEACKAMEGSWSRLLESMRIAVIRAFVDRAATLRSFEEDVAKAVCSTFGLNILEDQTHVVPCILYLMPLKDYLAKSLSTGGEPDKRNKSRKEDMDKLMEPCLPGSQLLQSLLQLSEPHNQLVTESLNTLSAKERIRLAQNPYSSHVYDALLESSSVSPNAKRKVVLDFIGHYHILVDDRIGSRIVDRFWEFADTYLKEKIAKSLFPHDKDLAASYHGRFFARNLNLQLLQRRPDGWRNMQAERKKQKEREQQVADEASSKTLDNSKEKANLQSPGKQSEGTVRKRKRKDDAIDAVFDASIGKKKATALQVEIDDHGVQPTEIDASLRSVLGSIKTAPRHESSPKKKHAKTSRL